MLWSESAEYEAKDMDLKFLDRLPASGPAGRQMGEARLNVLLYGAAARQRRKGAVT